MDPEDDIPDDTTDDTTDDGTDDSAPAGALVSTLAPAPPVRPVGVRGRQGAVDSFVAAQKALQAARNGDTSGLSNIGGVNYSGLAGISAGPSSDQQKLALAAAFLKPTMYRGLSATLGNVTGALAQNAQAQQQAQQAQQDLLTKYLDQGNLADISSADKQYTADTSAAARKYAADQSVAKQQALLAAKQAAAANAPPALVTGNGADLMAKYPTLTGLDPSQTYTVSGGGKAIAPLKEPTVSNPETDAVNAVINGTATPQQQAIYDAKYKQQPTAAEIANINKSQSTLESADNVIDNLNNALEFNKKAFDGPMADVQAGLSRWTNPDSEELKATAGLKTALGSNILANLKSTFGGRISNSELAYMSTLQGLQPNATRAERETSINYILNLANKKRAQVAQEFATAQRATATRTGQPASSTPSLQDLLAEKARRAASAGVQ